MFTFIELLGFSKRRQALLPDDEYRAFPEMLIEDPEAGDTIADTGGFKKDSLASARYGQARWYQGDLLHADEQGAYLSGFALP
jgi:hypothetical protein